MPSQRTSTPALSAGISDAATQRAIRVLQGAVSNVRPPTAVTTPTVPSSGVAITNNTGVRVTVYVRAGTLTAIAVDGVATGISAGAGAGAAHSISLSPGQAISITYTVTPVWVWIGS